MDLKQMDLNTRIRTAVAAAALAVLAAAGAVVASPTPDAPAGTDGTRVTVAAPAGYHDAG
jgi:hypothetical protein